jgi:hypothetical protein
MKFSNKFSYFALTTFLSLGFILSCVIANSKAAKAEDGIRFSKNGISLNANPAFGYKHGKVIASQFSTVQNDFEQLFEQNPVGNSAFLIKSKSLGECLNSYLTIVGSNPNFYPCNSNDTDQQMLVVDGEIYHKASGLKLNIGSKNNSTVSWVKPYEMLESGFNPVKILKSPKAILVFDQLEVGVKFFGSGIAYDVVKYCVWEESLSTCIEVGKEALSKSVNEQIKRDISIGTIFKIGSNNVNNFIKEKGMIYFVIPDKLPLSWNDSSKLCDKLSGNLKWHYGLKTCFK